MRLNTAEIEKRAVSLRQEHNVQTYGVKDIFSLVEQEDIELIRYPFGKDVLLGFATVYEGKKVIVSNSSEILSREIFTIAHELGHIVYDFEDFVSDVKIDTEISETSEDVAEARAYYFANCFLMPLAQLTEFIRLELKKHPEDLKALDIARIQLEFNVSYSAAVKWLCDAGVISTTKRNALYESKQQMHVNALFKMLDADELLIKPANVIKVPTQFLEYVTSNYENEYIPFSSLQKALELLGKDAAPFAKEEIRSQDDVDINKIFEEYQ